MFSFCGDGIFVVVRGEKKKEMILKTLRTAYLEERKVEQKHIADNRGRTWI